jgi:curli biogenesis system outer membrane secretion channel CsgG
MFQQDHIAINIHLVDLNANIVVASTTVEATPKDLGTALNLFSGSGGSVADVGAQMKTPIRKAIRACMLKAAVWAANNLGSK